MEGNASIEDPWMGSRRKENAFKLFNFNLGPLRSKFGLRCGTFEERRMTNLKAFHKHNRKVKSRSSKNVHV